MNFDSFSRFFEFVFENFDIEEIIFLVIAGTIFLLCYYATIHCICAVVRATDKAKNWRRDEHDCVASLCGHMLCRLHLDAIRLYLESVDIGFDITHCRSSRHQK